MNKLGCRESLTEEWTATLDNLEIRWDPQILTRQDAWAALLDDKIGDRSNPSPLPRNFEDKGEFVGQTSVDQGDPSYNFDQLKKWVTEDDLSKLGNTWFRSALQGESLFYPTNREQLTKYFLRKSSLFRVFVDTCILVIIIVPMMSSKQCFEHSLDNSATDASGVLLILCSLVQLFDCYLYFQTTHLPIFMKGVQSGEPNYSSRWELARLICCVALILNGFSSLIDQTIPRLALASIPVLVFVRRDDFKQLLQGVFYALRKITSYVKLWVVFLFVWAFMGFCLFRRYTADENDGGDLRYDSYSQALYTTLHCMLSRPTVLYRLKPIFPENNYSALYFVILTTIGDILLTTCVIALGTRQFRDFSKQVLDARSHYRKVALESLFFLYSAKAGAAATGREGSGSAVGRMSVQSWVTFCRHLGPYYKLDNADDAIALFSSEDKLASGYIDEKGFFRLSAAISTRLILFTQGFILPYQQRVEMMRTQRTSNTFTGRRQSIGDSMSRFSSSAKQVTEIYQRTLSTHLDRDSVDSLDVHSFHASQLFPKAATDDDRNSTISTLTSILDPGLIERAKQSCSAYFATTVNNSLFETYYTALGHFCVDLLHYELFIPVSPELVRNYYFRVGCKLIGRVVSKKNVEFTSMDTFTVNTIIDDQIGRDVSQSMEDSNKEATQPGADIKSYFVLFDVFQQFRRIIMFSLLVDTIFLAASNVTGAALAFAWLLFFLFVFECMVMSIGSQMPKFEMRYLVVLNIVVFFVLCSIGSDLKNLDQAALTLYFVLQSMRLARFVFNADSLRIFHVLTPVLIRVVILYALIVYSFAIIGNITLCQRIDSNSISSGDTDDDANSWVNFSNLLQFNTFFSSYYTMAVSAILSNWSMIMDAALYSTQINGDMWVYFFFYLFRISVVLLVIPLLMSCVIQTFITQLSKTEKVVKHRIRKKMGIEYYHIAAKEPGNDTILSLWLPSSNTKQRNDVEEATGIAKVYDVTQDKSKTKLLKYDKFATSVLLYPTEQTMISFNRTYYQDRRRESIATFGSFVSSTSFSSALSMAASSDSAYKIPKSLQDKLRNKRVVYRVMPASMIIDQVKTIYNIMHHKKKYNLDKLPTADYPMLTHCITRLPNQCLNEVAGIWLMDALTGSVLRFPTSIGQLQSLKILRNKYFYKLIYLVTLLQMFAIFLVVPRCIVDSSSDSAGRSAIPRLALNIFDLLCALIYLSEAFLHIHAIESPELSVDRGGDKNKKSIVTVFTKSWTGIRVLAIVMIAIKSILPLANPTVPINDIRLIRCIFPILLITRNDNYADIMKGILLSVKESKPVYKLFLAIVFVFTFAGYCLFHRYETDAGRFLSIFQALLTTLQCSVAAPFSLYVLTPYFSDTSQLTPIFFLMLSYFIEVLCVNLIVAAGNVHFNKFGEQTLNMRLARRYDGLLTIWLLLKSRPDPSTVEDTRKSYGEDGHMTLSRWVKFTQSLPVDYYISEEVAVLLFVYIKQQQEAKKDLNLSKLEEEEEELCINLEQFQSLLYLLLNGVRCRPHVSHHHRRRSSVSALRRPQSVRFKDQDKEQSTQEVQLQTFNSNARTTDRGSMVNNLEASNPLHDNSEPDDGAERDSRSRFTPRARPVSSRVSVVPGVGEVVYDVYYLREGIKGEPKPPKTYSRASCFQFYSQECFVMLDSAYTKVKNLCTEILEATIFDKLPFLGCVSLVVHALLLVQLSFFTSISQSSVGWLVFGYFLEIFFWIEMFILMFGFGLRRYFRDSMHLIRFIVNVGSFFSMIAMGATTDRSNNNNIYNTISPAFLFVVLFQCIRLGLVCVRVRGHGRYRVIIENTFRALFLFFLVLYIWSVMAQTAFCGVLSDDDDNVTISDGFTDDDASSWDQFNEILNFNNYAQSIFTMFEVAVLGSWSMIMDATVQRTSRKVPTYMFFFSFRLMMVLMILPLLVSFMVRSIIALNDRVSTLHRERKQRRERKAQLLGEEQRHIPTGQEKEQSSDTPTAPSPKKHLSVSGWLASRYRYLFDVRWVTLVPQRRERRLRTHSSFQDIWDNSLSWIVTKDSESGKYKGDDDEFSGSESDDDLDDDDGEGNENSEGEGKEGGEGEDGEAEGEEEREGPAAASSSVKKLFSVQESDEVESATGESGIGKGGDGAEGGDEGEN
ncbi:ion transporter [archaeon]|nr:MAG: ion transporter [archaeon]